MLIYSRTLIESLSTKILALAEKHAITIVAIDGPGAAGKTTLAQELAAHLGCASVVAMDDFIVPKLVRAGATKEPRQVGTFSDWTRLTEQVLEPLKQGTTSKYQRYDWNKDALDNWLTLPLSKIIIVEGVFALRKELLPYYNFKIWIDCPRQTRLARGLDRDGKDAESFWVDLWMPEEDRYIQEQEPQTSADLVIGNNQQQ